MKHLIRLKLLTFRIGDCPVITRWHVKHTTTGGWGDTDYLQTPFDETDDIETVKRVFQETYPEAEVRESYTYAQLTEALGGVAV